MSETRNTRNAGRRLATPTKNSGSRAPSRTAAPRTAERSAAEAPRPRPRPKKKRHYGVLVAVLFLAAIVAAAAAGANWVVNRYDKIYPGVSALGVELSGMTQEEALQTLEDRFGGEDVTATLRWTNSDGDPMTATKTFVTETNFREAAAAAYNVAREGNFLERLKAVIGTTSTEYKISVESALNVNGLEELIDQAADYIDRDAQSCTIQVKEDSVWFGPSQKGRTLNVEQAKEAFAEQVMSANGPVELDLDEFVTETAPGKPDVDAVYNSLYTEPVDSHFVFGEDGSITITESREGVSFDLEEARRRMSSEGAGFSLPIVRQRPKVTEEDLQGTLFRDKLASCTTKLNKYNYNRTGNVKLAANSINGTVLLPGDQFSYNQTVGERTEARGFKEASVYVSSGIEDQLGGGICQVSSTLYMACIRSRLEIVQRSNHAYTAAYAPNGQDATVYWGAVDYKFANNRDFPIKIVAWQADDYVTVEIYGTDVDGYTVTIEYQELSRTPYTTIEKPNPNMEYGTSKQVTEGHPQLSCVTYAIVKDKDGNQVDRYKIAQSNYKRLDRVVEVGTRNAPSTATPTPEPSAPPAETPAPATPAPETTPAPTTPEPTPAPTPEATPAPTPEPTPEPTPAPTPEATPAPTPGDGGGLIDPSTGG